MKKSPRRSVFLAAAFVLAQVTASPVAGVDEGRPPATPGLPARAALEDAYREFQTEATEQGAMGFYTDEATGELVVAVPRARSGSFRVPSAQLDVPVRVRTLSVDPARVDRALHLLEVAGPELTRGNDTSYTFRFDPEAGKVVVKGNLGEAEIAGVLEGLADVVEYHPGLSVIPASRNSMAPPFLGGAQAKRVGSANAFDCTTGFAVRKTSNGLRYMLTAAHCGALNSSWISPGSGHTIGVMRFRQLGPSDVALLGDKTYQPAIYTSGAAGIASTVKGAANPVLNNPIYCASGAVTFEHCEMWVVSMSTSNCYSGGCFTNQMTYKKGGSCPKRLGDSGGPIYLDFDLGGLPYIRGMNVAHLSDFSECYGEYWSRISGALGVTIVTG